MALIDTTYFVGELHIAGIRDIPEVKARVEACIDKYESDFLQQALGYALYKAFLADTNAQRFQDLLKGKEYTAQDGRLRKWAGLVPEAGDSPVSRSPIAGYVYFHYMRSAATSTTQVGEVVPNADNATRVSPARKLCAAWNEMSGAVLDLLDFLHCNASLYPEWQHVDGHWAACGFKRINHFGI